MRAGVIYRVVSRMLWFSAATLAFLLLTSLLARDGAWLGWLIAAALSALLGSGLARTPAALEAPKDSLRRREGFLVVVLAWLVMIFSAAIALHITGEFAGFAEAFFESCSGFTTTGATVAVDIEALPDSILIFRSLSHWIGGMGIIVLSVAILPELGVGGLQLFAAESSVFDADKLAPRIAATARRLWILYVTITGVLTILLALGPMSAFDAFNHAMATIGTGGFSTKNASIGHYDSLYIEVVIILFMFVSGISFVLQYRAIFGLEFGRLWKAPEVRLYSIITVAAIVAITLNLWLLGPLERQGYDALGALRASAFTTVSIITTTGFSTDSFNEWPDLSRAILVGVMLIGGCAGSTSGGSKVIRLYVVAKHAAIQLRKLVRPKVVVPLVVGDRDIATETIESILGYYLLYFAATMLIGLGLTAMGLDLVTGTTAAISTMNSIGPGLDGVSASFIDVPDPGLYLSCVGMLLGRLEIYPILVLLTLHFWRR